MPNGTLAEEKSYRSLSWRRNSTELHLRMCAPCGAMRHVQPGERPETRGMTSASPSLGPSRRELDVRFQSRERQAPGSSTSYRPRLGRSRLLLVTARHQGNTRGTGHLRRACDPQRESSPSGAAFGRTRRPSPCPSRTTCSQGMMGNPLGRSILVSWWPARRVAEQLLLP